MDGSPGLLFWNALLDCSVGLLSWVALALLLLPVWDLALESWGIVDLDCCGQDVSP